MSDYLGRITQNILFDTYNNIRLQRKIIYSGLQSNQVREIHCNSTLLLKHNFMNDEYIRMQNN